MPDRVRDTGGPPDVHDRVRGSAVRRVRPRVLAVMLLVEAVAAALALGGLVATELPTPVQVWHAVAVCLLGVVHTEAAFRVEPERRRLSGAEHVDLSSVWPFAAAIVLTAPHAALVAIILGAHLCARTPRLQMPLHRQLFTVATVVLAGFATNELLVRLDPALERPLWVLAVALLTFAAVRACLAAVVTAQGSRMACVSVLRARWDEVALELGLLCLGALTAVALVTGPWTVVFVLPPVLGLLRAALVRPLAAAASTDGKTGLLNARTWLTEADRLLRSTPTRVCGVLVLDLDHFKSVNDTHGHVVGDQVLAAVADVLRRVVRAHDLTGRMGGEEFVVIPLATARGVRPVELEVMGERIRARIAALQVEVETPYGPMTIGGLSVSIGGAVVTAHGADLARLLQAADAALYAAKRAGRNQVWVRAPRPAEPVPGRPDADAPPVAGRSRDEE